MGHRAAQSASSSSTSSACLSPSMRNREMTAARIAKKDEFYTNIADICKEMQNYDFNGMIVYCNCDNPQKSAF